MAYTEFDIDIVVDVLGFTVDILLYSLTNITLWLLDVHHRKYRIRLVDALIADASSMQIF